MEIDSTLYDGSTSAIGELMRIEKRISKEGITKYSFIYYCHNNKTNVRLRESEIIERYGKTPTNEEQAIDAKRILTMSMEVRRLEFSRLQAWRNKFLDYSSLLDEFKTKWMPKRAPNSFKNTNFYLENYVLFWFLGQNNLNNPMLWPDNYIDFKNWLNDTATLTTNKNKGISNASKTNCIKSLNNFIKFLKEKKIIKSIEHCASIDKNRKFKRTIDDVVLPNEFEAVYGELRALDQEIADYYRVLYFTGLRSNEAFGLSLDDFIPGEPEGLLDSFGQYGYQCHGYLVLESQPKEYPVRNEQSGIVVRKPLKSKYDISPENSRTIPIIDKMAFNFLATCFNREAEKFDRRLHGSDKKDYLFFPNVTRIKVRRALAEAYKNLKLRAKSPHCLRHSRATLLAGETKNFLLIQQWLGHTKQETTMQYIHLAGMLNKKAKMNSLIDGKRIELIS